MLKKLLDSFLNPLWQKYARHFYFLRRSVSRHTRGTKNKNNDADCSQRQGLKRSLFLTLLILSLSSCGRYWYKPYGRLFNQLPKGGTPGFELGWLHGCESGLGNQFGGGFYMTFYTWKKDPDIASISRTPEVLERIRKRYKNEKIANINWNNLVEVNKNFSDYNSIFWGAHIFCRHAILGSTQMSNVTGSGPPLPGEERYNPAKSSIGDVYRIDGKGDARYSYW